MCGIVGFLGLDGDAVAGEDVLRAMTDTLVHRGPDMDGYHIDGPVALGVRRLSIIDVAGGRMPITGCDENTVVVQNGEIYNFAELRERLVADGHRFKTNTDTEALVHLYEAHGVEMVHKLVGMFGFAIWDKREQRLFLARDRMGQKPLYLFQQGRVLAFASELKALLKLPGVARELDPRALATYLVHEHVPAPLSIFRNITKLRPGEAAIIERGNVRIWRYWQPTLRPDKTISKATAIEETQRLLWQSVRARMISDVPLGVLLSGGIDSSTVAALAAKSVGRIKTFSIAFREKSFDESSHARTVARAIGSDHHEDMLTPAALIELIDHIGEFLDEPLADASIVPTYLLCRFVRKHVTVALGGDGGDELFLGYPTYAAHKVAAYLDALPKLVRGAVLPALVSKIPVSTDNFSIDFKIKRFVRGLGFDRSTRHLAWMGSFLPGDLDELLSDSAGLLDAPLAIHDDRLSAQRPTNPVEMAELLDMGLYLSEGVLVKVDRASMANSLELRAPFLDHRLVDFVLTIPAALRAPKLTAKMLLKEAVSDLLPHEIIHRPKKGFGIPVAAWMKAELKPLLLEMLSPERLLSQGVFNPGMVQRLVDEHLQGRFDHRKQLWTLLVFQLWWDRWMR